MGALEQPSAPCEIVVTRSQSEGRLGGAILVTPANRKLWAFTLSAHM